MAVTIMASAGSFAAISTLLGSPLLGAFLIMEAAGIAGATLSLVALPGLLASGHRCPGLPRPRRLDRPGHLLARADDGAAGGRPHGGEPALGHPGRPPRRPAGLGGPLGRPDRAPARAPQPGAGDHRARRARRPHRHGLPADHRQRLHRGALLRPGRPARASWPTPPTTPSATLVVLGLCKMLAYGLSLSAFRGGPVFPAMFIGAVLGIALSGLPGMSLAPRSAWASVRCAARCSACRSPRSCWPPSCSVLTGCRALPRSSWPSWWPSSSPPSFRRRGRPSRPTTRARGAGGTCGIRATRGVRAPTSLNVGPGGGSPRRVSRRPRHR